METRETKEEEEEKQWVNVINKGSEFTSELKKVSCMAAPMVVVSLLQYLFQVVALAMAGHLGDLSLSGASVATSFANVTGFSVMFGLAEGLETLCGQAYGAGQYQKYATYTYSAIVSLIPICIPISILWFYMEPLLVWLGQDPEISAVAGSYATCLIPALFAYAILQSLLRHFQSQSLIAPLFWGYFATLCFHVIICWVLVYKRKLGNTGAALSIGISYWFNVAFLAIYMRQSSSCQKTRAFYSKDVLSSTKEFLQFAVPASFMVCLEWWTFELVVLMAGRLPNSKLETSVLSICLMTTSWNYFIQCGIGAAASTRVSNELGASNPVAARAVVRVVLMISLTEAMTVSAALYCSRYIYGYAFSNDKNVVEYVAEVVPLLCLSLIVDSILATLSGIARGCGWQRIGAFVNLGAYYLFGIPVSVILCFFVHLRGKGLWIGILSGSTLQAVLLAFVTAFTDWKKQAVKARKRIFDGTCTEDDVLPEVELGLEAGEDQKLLPR